MQNKEFFEEKLVESAEIMVDVSDTYKVKLQELTKLFKFGFGQPTKDFKEILDYQFFVHGIPNPDSVGKLEKVLSNFITAIRYFTFLGMDEEKISRGLQNYGITINKIEWTPVGGEKSNQSKFNKLWEQMYPNEAIPAINAELLKFLLSEGVNSKTEVLTLTDDCVAIAEAVEVKCEIGKSSFNKGVQLKTKVLRGKDIAEDVVKIEHKADEVSQIIELMG